MTFLVGIEFSWYERYLDEIEIAACVVLFDTETLQARFLFLFLKIYKIDWLSV